MSAFTLATAAKGKYLENIDIRKIAGIKHAMSAPIVHINRHLDAQLTPALENRWYNREVTIPRTVAQTMLM